ncbi:MAG: hypothetical protein MI739_08250 [Bacteroidales bacterium]|nr:hypothetical protein [Bacteroidales bacterium]
MNDEQKNITIIFKDKIQRLFSLYNSLKAENEDLKEKSEELILKLKNKDSEIEFLKNKYDKLKLAKNLIASTNDSHDAKVKISRIVREIDKCIALLNR